MLKNSSLKATGPSYGQTIVCSDNPGQNIWHKVKKYSKIGQDYKNLISNFPCFMSPPKFDIFLTFPNFLRSYVLSRSATRVLSLISSVVLLVAIWTCTKFLKRAKLLRPGLW